MLRFYTKWGNKMYFHAPRLTAVLIGNRFITKAVRWLFHGSFYDASTPMNWKEMLTLGTSVAIFAFVLGWFFRRAAEVSFRGLLERKDFPMGLSALEMLWPERLREEVWHPAFYDAQAVYIELREPSWMPMLNVIFTLKVLYLIVVTGRIAFLDWSLSRLTNKRSRLTGKGTRRKGKVD